MRVTQIASGRFHHFDLARQFERLGLLERLYTGYPIAKLRHEGIPLHKVDSFPWLMVPRMALARSALLSESWLASELAWRAHETLDLHAACTLPRSDVVVALSGAGLRVGIEAKGQGAKYVCDRGSTHIRFQDRVLREECARWGVRYRGVDSRVMGKEEAEYHEADAIIVPSEFALSSFLDLGVPESKLRKVPYGVSAKTFSREGAPPGSPFTVLFVGSVGIRKGLPYLLQAFNGFKHPAKRLLVVGAVLPHARAIIDRLVRSPDIKFLGHLPQDRLGALMSTAHVMVLPSVEEGLALVMAQALACGCPVIASSSTGAADLYTDGTEGFITPPRDAQAISDRLHTLADDPELREKMSTAAHRRAKALRGWDAYGDNVARVLDEVVGRSSWRNSSVRSEHED